MIETLTLEKFGHMEFAKKNNKKLLFKVDLITKLTLQGISIALQIKCEFFSVGLKI